MDIVNNKRPAIRGRPISQPERICEQEDAGMSTLMVGVIFFYVVCITEMIHAMHVAPTWDGSTFK